MSTKMSRTLVLPALCGMVSLAMMAGVYHWLEETDALDSQQAFSQAEQALKQHCSRQGKAACQHQLMDMTAPQNADSAWQFEFQSVSGTPMTVQVYEDGATRLLAHRGR